VTIQRAILELRKALSLTQRGLAAKLQTSNSSIPKYEKGRIPDATVLLRLEHLAEDGGQHELAAIFHNERYRQMRVPESWEGVMHFEPRTDEERFLTAGLLAAWRSPDLRDQQPYILAALLYSLHGVANKIERHQQSRAARKNLHEWFKQLEAAGAGKWDKKERKFVFFNDKLKLKHEIPDLPVRKAS
jgi:transcriptional regulator with XRE-family HTH domain